MPAAAAASPDGASSASLPGGARPASAPRSSTRAGLWLGLLGLWVGLVGGLTPDVARADQRDPRLAELFERLRDSPSPRRSSQIAEQIWGIWNTVGDPELDSLMKSASGALDRGELTYAVDLFTTLIERAPDFAEGWNKRATAYYQMGQYEASIQDVAVVLRLEPRHFAALSGMGLIYTELGADSPALRWFEQALAVHPHLRGVPEQVEALRVKLHTGEI